MRAWMLLLGVVVLGCQTRTAVARVEACAQTCLGCCDATGTCLTGEDDDACGAPGKACGACEGTSSCVERVCRARQAPPVDAGASVDAGVAAPMDAGVVEGPVDAGTSTTPCPPDGWCLDGLGPSGAPVTTNHLRSVWVRASDDVWAVGDLGTVLHFDGAAWRVVGAGLTDDLHAVWASGPSDVWVAGGSGDPGATNGLVAHFDGAQWRVVARGLKRIEAIWGRGANEVWFGGWAGTLLRWDGAALSPVASPTTKHIADLTGTATRIWAVGSSGLVLEFDGATWREVPTGMADGLTVALAFGPSLAWAAGGSAFATWDGTTWRAFTGLQSITVMGLWGANPSEAWGVGPGGEVHRFSGTTPTRISSPTTNFLRDVHGSDASHVWAVGFSGTVLRLRP
jgi:hypothetical protein